MQPQSNLIIYQAEDGSSGIGTHLENETIRLTQAQMTELFHKSRSTITAHIQHIFEEGELDEISVCRIFRYTGLTRK